MIIFCKYCDQIKSKQALQIIELINLIIDFKAPIGSMISIVLIFVYVFKNGYIKNKHKLRVSSSAHFNKNIYKFGRNMQKRTLKPTIQVLTYLKEGLNSWPTCEMTYKWQRWISTYLFQYHKHQENSKSFAIWQEGRSCATWQRLKFKKECIIQYKKAGFSSCFIYKSHCAYTKYLLT